MRKYSVGAVLLDKDDPSKVIGRTEQPLLAAQFEARARERDWSPGRCEALCPRRWYGVEHRCGFRGAELIEGHWVCGTHARALRKASR